MIDKNLRAAPIIAETEAGQTAFIVADVPDGAPDIVREGIARRRILAATRECPCGARVEMPSRQRRRAAERWGEVPVAQIWHANDCPAGDDILLPAVDAWQGTT